MSGQSLLQTEKVRRWTSQLIYDDIPQTPNASDPSAYWRSAQEQNGDWGDIFCILSSFLACVQFWAEIEIAKSWNTLHTFDRDVNRDNQLCQKCAVPMQKSFTFQRPTNLFRIRFSQIVEREIVK